MSRLDPATITPKRPRCHALIHGGREREQELPYVITRVRKNAFRVRLFFPSEKCDANRERAWRLCREIRYCTSVARLTHERFVRNASNRGNVVPRNESAFSLDDGLANVGVVDTRLYPSWKLSPDSKFHSNGVSLKLNQTITLCRSHAAILIALIVTISQEYTACVWINFPRETRIHPETL